MSRDNAIAVGLLLGIGAIAASFFVPESSIARGHWSDAEAKQFQELSRKLHEQSFLAGTKSGRERFDQLRGEYRGLEVRLQAATSRGKALKLLLVALGVGAVGVAAAAKLASANRSRRGGRP